MSATTIDRTLTDELTADITTTGTDTAPVMAPFTGTLLHDLPLSTVQDVKDAAAAARVAQAAWWEAGDAHRRRVLLKAHDLLLERKEQLLDILQTESGKTRGQAFEEIFQGANVTRYSALGARKALATKRRRAGIPFVMVTHVTYQPKGLAGVITPWNYPVSLSLMDVVPALATGNAVLQKADNQGALSILASRRAYIDAGLPAALWPVVTGPGAEIGSAVIDEADVVCFTGSTPTGKQVAAQAAGKLTYASLELGGKNPLIVLDDVEPAKAAAAAVYACFSSMGQLCVSDERILVQRAVAEPFIAEFVRRTKALKQGSALDYSSDVGALTLPSQVERVQQHVDDAVEKGATVLAGGRIRDDLGPNFYEPTVLTGVTAEMSCFANETFGPVVWIQVVDTEDEAIAAANDSEYGLNASVFSGSAPRAFSVAERIHCGSVNINEGYRATFSSADAPMGGMKASGLGRRNGPEGLARFVESRTIARATGLLALPRVGPQFERLAGPMLLLLKLLKTVRRR
jgi:succinate-semialdehyde dehydrogenase/glutarate-semialdehyde dehydrogenase